MSRWQPVLANKSRTFSTTMNLAILCGLVLATLYLWITPIKPERVLHWGVQQLKSELTTVINPNKKGKADRDLIGASRAVEGYSSYFYYSLAVFGLGMFGSFALLSDIMKKQEAKIAKGEYVSGNRQVSYEQAIKEVAAKLKDPMTAYDYRHTPQDIIIKAHKKNTPFRFPRYAGAGHTMYLGASGSGKSQLMFHILKQIRQAGSKAIIIDPGGRYYARFGKAGDRIFSIYDKRGEYYDFWSEPGFDYFAMASSLIDSKGAGGGRDDFFKESPQSLFAGLLRISKDGGMNELKKHIYDPDVEFLQQQLQENTEVSAQFLKEPKLAAHVMASYATKLYWLKYLNHWAEEAGKTEKRGISEWARDDQDRSWVFLVADERDWEASKHFFRMLVTLAGKSVYGRGEYPGRVDIHEIQDEIESIGYNAEFSQKLNIGRKDGYIMHGGLQAITQFESIYGVNEAKTIIQGFQNKFLFRSEDPELSRRMAQITGPGRWRVKDENVSNEGKSAVTMKIEERPAFRAEEFGELRPTECVGKISGINPFKFAMGHRQYPIVHPESMSEIPPI
jgi:Type IV secretion-system coupling protein DNA-binding domain